MQSTATRPRLFLGIALDDVCAAQVQGIMPVMPGIIPRANWHLTLRFLGATDSDVIARLDALLKQQHLSGGVWQAAYLDAFPPGAQVVAALQGDTPPWLGSLVNGVDAVLAELGFAPRDQAFLPHISLLRGALPCDRIAVDIAVPCREVCLFESRQNENGVYYTPLFVYPLG